MAGGQQAENTLHENAIGWIILGAVIAVLIWLFWYYFDAEVRNMVRWVRYGEMWIVKLFIDLFEMLGLVKDGEYKVFWPATGQEVSWQAGFESTPNYRTEKLTYTHLSLFGALAMEPLKMPIVGILGAMAFWAMFKGPNTQYRSNLGLEGLMARQAEVFPVITPFIEFNPATQPPRSPGTPVPAELPSFAEALGPEEWLAYEEIPIPDGQIDEQAAFNAFRKQLGPRWKGPQKLKPYKQVLLASFCLKAARKRKEADAMLGRLACCWSFKKGLNLAKDKTLLKEARKILNDKKLSGETLGKCNQHAYEVTALLRALQTAREEGGVLAPALFVWLRGYDRTLWYPLNNIGRQSFHMEALGAMSHYVAEKRTSRPIPVPKLDDAVYTIKEYMGSMRARPIPVLDYSHSKKKSVKKAV
ncbi:MAG: type IV secretion system protein [Alphaproteobacteria bacterium]